MANRELEKLLEKLDNIRSAEALTSEDIDLIVRHIKEERKNARQTGPAKGQKYWFAQVCFPGFYEYTADDFDLNICKNTSIYPEERFAEAERRAKRLIVGVNKKRRELNEGKEFGDRKCYIVFCRSSGVEAWEESNPLYARVNAYPFGLFKDFEDCETCMREFEDELEWFYEEYLPLMEELDGYDWAEAPGWGEEV